MGIFNGLLRTRDAPRNRTSGSTYSFFMGGSTSGKHVNERTSMQMTAVYSCVRILSEAIASLPLNTLVGSNFAGLSGAALTSACLAYLGGGAIAAGGLGMAGGTIAIVGGGAILGVGVGAGVSGAAGAISLMGKKNTILQSVKLMVSVREVFLNDEKDVKYSNTVYEKYVQNITDIEKGLIELRLKGSSSN